MSYPGVLEDKMVYIRIANLSVPATVTGLTCDDFPLVESFYVLPADTLGSYYLIVTDATTTEKSFVAIGGVEDDTEVMIMFNATNDVDFNGTSYDKRATIIFQLNRFQSVFLLDDVGPNSDFTGTNVLSTKPIAVSAGNICMKKGTCICIWFALCTSFDTPYQRTS